MKVNKCGAALSKIVQIGEKLKKLSAETGQTYLPLNRGIPSVVPIDLTGVVKGLDFNAPLMQTYPEGPGFSSLREAINDEFFQGQSNKDNLLITGGGMNGLDLLIQALGIEKLYLPVYYWGPYFHLLNIRGVGVGEYTAQSDLYDRLDELKGSGVLICDPGNPLGEKYDDEELFRLVKTLSDAGIVVLFDSPYRRIFSGREDDFYARLLPLGNVIISESFSKSVGLSGQRIGFIHTTNKELRDELEIRLMYCTNGINAFAQSVVLALLTTPEGQQAVADFKQATARDIMANIDYLKRRGLLAEEFYRTSTPRGIFAVVDRTEDQLLEARIGSVSLSFFTKSEKARASNFARVCVSMPHDKFVAFFDGLN